MPFPHCQPQAHLGIYRLSDITQLPDLPEEGVFEVEHGGTRERFTSIILALMRYMQVEDSAWLYDVTGEQITLEMKLRLKEPTAQ